MTNEEITKKGEKIVSDFYKSFSIAMDQEMTARKMSATQLQNRIGHDAGTIRIWRRGARYPSPETMARIAAYFGYESLIAFVCKGEIRKEIDEWAEIVEKHMNARLDHLISKINEGMQYDE